MSTEIIIALIAAIGSVIGSIITLVIGMRNLKLEKEKLQMENVRRQTELQLERDKLKTEIKQSTEQAQLRQLEFIKIQAEADKLIAETKAIQRSEKEKLCREIRDILSLFNRAAFFASRFNENPFTMFAAIQQTRISLQISGATSIPDGLVAENSEIIIRILFDAETTIASKYPMIADWVKADLHVAPPSQERHERLELLYNQLERMGGRYAPVGEMLKFRDEITPYLEQIREHHQALCMSKK